MVATFADLRRGSGAVVISAAGGMEFALESREWNNGVFTYALLRGLKDKQADRNKDGRIQVSELRTYVLDEVRRLTRDRQAPTVRMENLEFDYTVDGEFRKTEIEVLTLTQAASKAGKKVMVQFRVQGAGVNGEFVELYSEPAWHRAGNMFIRFSESTRKKFQKLGIPDVVRHFHSKLIRATGTVTILRFEAGSYPCIVIDDPGQILVPEPSP